MINYLCFKIKRGVRYVSMCCLLYLFTQHHAIYVP
jgi:hypothetical protein